MTLIALIAATLAGLLHVFIFLLESFRWQEDNTRRVFGTTPEQAETTKQLAYNQGFYNLFLAIGTTLGLVLFWIGDPGTVAQVAGRTLVLFSLGSMVAAALVLLTSGRRYRGAALVQGLIPLLGFVLVLFA